MVNCDVTHASVAGAYCGGDGGVAGRGGARHTWQGGGERAGSRPRHTACAPSHRLALSETSSQAQHYSTAFGELIARTPTSINLTLIYCIRKFLKLKHLWSNSKMKKNKRNCSIFSRLVMKSLVL